MWRLIGDIGGTNARFALVEQGDNSAKHEITLSCADYPDLAAAASDYLKQVDVDASPEFAVVALATALDGGDNVDFTNNHWNFSITETKSKLGLKQLKLYNDFTALALALPHFDDADVEKVGGGTSLPGHPIALIGAGTGLGVSGLVPDGQGGWIPLSTEGGHCSIATLTSSEQAVVEYTRQSYPHVSFERLVSGSGIENIYQALCAIDGVEAKQYTAADITDNAKADNCDICVEAVNMFCDFLGTAAGNLVVSLGARGGVFIGGGIVPKLGEFFVNSGFRSRFEFKGRFTDYLGSIECKVITHENPAMLGLAAKANELHA